MHRYKPFPSGDPCQIKQVYNWMAQVTKFKWLFIQEPILLAAPSAAISSMYYRVYAALSRAVCIPYNIDVNYPLNIIY